MCTHLFLKFLNRKTVSNNKNVRCSSPFHETILFILHTFLSYIQYTYFVLLVLVIHAYIHTSNTKYETKKFFGMEV